MVFSKSANSDGVVADNVGDVVSNLPIESIVVVDKIRLSSVKTETLLVVGSNPKFVDTLFFSFYFPNCVLFMLAHRGHN